jgi:hypothetical protein
MRKQKFKITPLIESKILTNGTQIQKLMLQEFNTLNEEMSIAKFIYEESLHFKKLGYSQERINEEIASGALGSLLDAGGDGLIDTMKSYLINWLLGKVGLDPAQEGKWGLIGCAISNTIEELDVATFKNIFSQGSAGFSEEGLKGIWPKICGDMTDLILRGVTECATNKAQRSKMMMKFYTALVGEVDDQSKITQNNVLWKTSDEMLQNYINDTAFMESLRGTVSGYLCELDIGEMFKGITGSLGGMADTVMDALGLDFGSLFGGTPATA